MFYLFGVSSQVPETAVTQVSLIINEVFMIYVSN